MNVKLLRHLWLFIIPLLIGCSNEDEPLNSPVEIFGVRMFVTNDAGKDVIANSEYMLRTAMYQGLYDERQRGRISVNP